jgi:hypothetical protein
LFGLAALAFIAYEFKADIDAWVYWATFTPPALILVLWGVATVASMGKGRIEQTQDERDAFARAREALEAVKGYLLEEKPGWMWWKLKQALFAPRSVPWTKEMVQHDRQVVEFVLAHASDQLGPEELQDFEKLARNLATTERADGVPKVDMWRFGNARRHIEDRIEGQESS